MPLLKEHKEDCTAGRLTPELSAYISKYPNYCRECRGTGQVRRSGLMLNCAHCFSGNPVFRCPRCMLLASNVGFWNYAVDCKHCGWRGPADGAPVADCDCPEAPLVVELVGQVAPTKAAAARDRAATLAKQYGMTAVADSDDHKTGKRTDADRDKGNERRRTGPAPTTRQRIAESRQARQDSQDARELDEMLDESEAS
jgi:hypothetical protein